MLRLYLLAHAPTGAQRQGRFPADEGIEAVDQAVADRVMASVGPCDALRSGPERRCTETATALNIGTSPCEALAAWSAGAWAGHDIQWVAENDPEGLRSWRTDPEFAPDGGESLTGFLERVAGWMQAQERPAGRSLVIADSSVIRAASLYVLDAGPRSFWRLDIAPWSLTVAQHAHGEWRLRSLNAVARIDLVR